MNEYSYVRCLSKIGKDDLNLAGGKGANLGEMIKTGLPVPEGMEIGAELEAEDRLDHKEYIHGNP